MHGRLRSAPSRDLETTLTAGRGERALITRIEQPGATMVRARATDLAGRTQPESPEWNRLGYGNNCIPEVPVHVRG